MTIIGKNFNFHKDGYSLRWSEYTLELRKTGEHGSLLEVELCTGRIRQLEAYGYSDRRTIDAFIEAIAYYRENKAAEMAKAKAQEEDDSEYNEEDYPPYFEDSPRVFVKEGTEEVRWEPNACWWGGRLFEDEDSHEVGAWGRHASYQSQNPDDTDIISFPMEALLYFMAENLSTFTDSERYYGNTALLEVHVSEEDICLDIEGNEATFDWEDTITMGLDLIRAGIHLREKLRRG